MTSHLATICSYNFPPTLDSFRAKVRLCSLSPAVFIKHLQSSVRCACACPSHPEREPYFQIPLGFVPLHTEMSNQCSSIMDWVMDVPTRDEREDPFNGDGFLPPGSDGDVSQSYFTTSCGNPSRLNASSFRPSRMQSKTTPIGPTATSSMTRLWPIPRACPLAHLAAGASSAQAPPCLGRPPRLGRGFRTIWTLSKCVMTPRSANSAGSLAYSVAYPRPKTSVAQCRTQSLRRS